MSPGVILTVTKGLPCLKLSECVRPGITDERGMVKYEKNISPWYMSFIPLCVHNWNFIAS